MVECRVIETIEDCVGDAKMLLGRLPNYKEAIPSQLYAQAQEKLQKLALGPNEQAVNESVALFGQLSLMQNACDIRGFI